MKTKLYVVFVFIISLLAYSNTLANRYTSEDYYLINSNHFIKDFSNIKLLLGKDRFLTPAPIRNGARPLTVFSLMLDYKIWQENPFGFHLTNLLLHALNCMLVFILFIRLNVKAEHSFIAALIYMLHPIQTEVVNVPGFRGDLLAAFFFLAGLILFIKIIKSKKYLYAPLIVIIYGAALLSKEVTVVMPIVLGMYYMLCKGFKKKAVASIFLFLMVFGIGYFFIFWVDRYRYDIFDVIFVNLSGQVKPFSSLAAYVNTIFTVFFMYMKNIILPVNLNYDYQLTIYNVIQKETLAGAAALLAMLVFMLKTKNRPVKFSLGLFLITYMPASNVAPLFNIMADRYMYIPMIGFSYFIAYLLLGIFGRLEKLVKLSSGSFSIKNILLLLVFSLYFAITFNRNFIFRNMLSLYLKTEEQSPDNPRVIYNLAVAYKEENMFYESIDALKRVLELNPLYRVDRVWQMLGENYHVIGDIDRAKKYYIKVMLLNPKRATLNNLARILYDEGNISGSRMLWQKVLSKYPGDQQAEKGLEMTEDYKELELNLNNGR